MIYCDVSHNYFLYLFSLCFIIDPSYYYKNICKADYLTWNLNPFNAAYFCHPYGLLNKGYVL